MLSTKHSSIPKTQNIEKYFICYCNMCRNMSFASDKVRTSYVDRKKDDNWETQVWDFRSHTKRSCNQFFAFGLICQRVFCVHHMLRDLSWPVRGLHTQNCLCPLIVSLCAVNTYNCFWFDLTKFQWLKMVKSDQCLRLFSSRRQPPLLEKCDLMFSFHT